MRNVKSTYLAVASALALTFWGATAAHAVTCPASGGTRTYTVAASAGCAFGSGNITTTDIPAIEGIVGTYYGPGNPANIGDPAVPDSVVPGLVKTDTNAGGVYVSPYASVVVANDLKSGTITFLQALTDTFFALKDGGDPKWAVFTLGSVLANQIFTWSMTGGQLSHFTIFGNPGEIPLPPALILFGSALIGMTLLGRRRQRASQFGEMAA